MLVDFMLNDREGELRNKQVVDHNAHVPSKSSSSDATYSHY